MTWQPRTLGEFLLEAEGFREALVTPLGRLTYQELREKAERAAAAMQALGIGRGDRVAILMPNDEQWLTLFYGAALIGAVTVPVNTRFKTAEIDFCLKQSGAKALFYVDRFLNNDYGTMVKEIKPGLAVDVSGNAFLRGPLSAHHWASSCRHLVRERAAQLDSVELPASRTVEIPVRYGGETGPDLESVAAMHGISAEEVVRLHSEALYTVYLLPFEIASILLLVAIVGAVVLSKKRTPAEE